MFSVAEPSVKSARALFYLLYQGFQLAMKPNGNETVDAGTRLELQDATPQHAAAIALLVEEFRNSRNEIALVTAHTATAVQSILAALAAVIAGIVAESLNLAEVDVRLADIVIVMTATVLFISVLLFTWMVGNFAFVITRSYFEATHLRSIAYSMTGDSRLLFWDVFQHPLKKIWNFSRSVTSALTFSLVLSLQAVFVFGILPQYNFSSFGPWFNTNLSWILVAILALSDLFVLSLIAVQAFLGSKYFGELRPETKHHRTGVEPLDEPVQEMAGQLVTGSASEAKAQQAPASVP